MVHGETGPLNAVFAGLSAESRNSRYLTGLPRLTPRMTRALTDLDARRHVAWLATVADEPVGIARHVLIEDGLAEVAVEVVDSMQGRGIGGALLAAVVRSARTSGVRELSASVHPGNTRVIRLLSRNGATISHVGGLVEARVLLPPVAIADASESAGAAEAG